MKAYYNEWDKNAAAWLRELIKEGLITDGEVDERSIEDVLPADLAGFDRCHFFAGIGVWDYALNLAGFDGQVWTGSCPCQPFSSAGKREGLADERHLWPAFFHLISQCRPNTLFGEQVSSTDGRVWLDIVSADLEASGYTIGTLDLPASSVGAPHKRQRFFFVGADVNGMEKSAAFGRRRRGDGDTSGGGWKVQVEGRSGSGKLDDTNRRRCEQRDESKRDIQESDAGCSISRMDDAIGYEYQSDRGKAGEADEVSQLSRTAGRSRRISGTGGNGRGFWDSAEWVYCNDPDDPKWRPIEPGTFPLVARPPDRVALLRGYGNSIVPQVAQAFIESYLEGEQNGRG